jgi:hypothetical protein
VGALTSSTSTASRPCSPPIRLAPPAGPAVPSGLPSGTGLFLERVLYPGDPQLAALAHTTRVIAVS